MTKAPFLGLLGKSLMFHDYYGGEGGILKINHLVKAET